MSPQQIVAGKEKKGNGHHKPNGNDTPHWHE